MMAYLASNQRYIPPLQHDTFLMHVAGLSIGCRATILVRSITSRSIEYDSSACFIYIAAVSPSWYCEFLYILHLSSVHIMDYVTMYWEPQPQCLNCQKMPLKSGSLGTER